MPEPARARQGTGSAGRRGVVSAAFAGLVVALAAAIARDLAWVQAALVRVGRLPPEPVTRLVDAPEALALTGLGLLALMLAVGTFLVGRETAGAFAVLAAGTVAWLAFPYAEVPWTALLTGAKPAARTPPVAVWSLSVAIVALATVEVLASGRGHLLATLGRAGLAERPGASAREATRRARNGLAAAALVLGGGAATAYMATRGALRGLFTADLLWAPIVLGVLLAAALLVVARRR